MLPLLAAPLLIVFLFYFQVQLGVFFFAFYVSFFFVVFVAFLRTVKTHNDDNDDDLTFDSIFSSFLTCKNALFFQYFVKIVLFAHAL